MCGHRPTCSQVSAVLFYAWTAKFVRAQICVGHMRVSRLKVKDRQHHLSQNIGPAIAGSAGVTGNPIRAYTDPGAPLIPRIESAEVGSKPLAYLIRPGSDFRGDRIRCDTGPVPPALSYGLNE